MEPRRRPGSTVVALLTSRQCGYGVEQQSQNTSARKDLDEYQSDHERPQALSHTTDIVVPARESSVHNLREDRQIVAGLVRTEFRPADRGLG